MTKLNTNTNTLCTTDDSCPVKLCGDLQLDLGFKQQPHSSQSIYQGLSHFNIFNQNKDKCSGKYTNLSCQELDEKINYILMYVLVNIKLNPAYS